MPAFCCVIKCGSRGERDKVKFYSIPKVLNFKHKEQINHLSKLRRQKWIDAIRREDLTESKLKYATVCSKHFISGRPAGREDVDNPDWAPNLNLGYSDKIKSETPGETDLKCFRSRKKLKKEKPETISTCRFAQRVSMISTTPVINEIRDPQKEIAFLRNTVDELRRQISQLSHLSTGTALDKNQEEHCRREVERYVASTSDELKVAPSMASIQYCFKLMRDKINSRSSEEQPKKELESVYGLNIKKENENDIIEEMQENLINLNRLTSKKNLLSSHDTKETNKNVIVNYWTNERDLYPKYKTQYDKVPSESNLRASKTEPDGEKQLFEAFLKDPENSKDLDYYTRNLQKKLETAKIHADTIDQCQKNITYIRRQLQTRSDNSLKNKLVVELEEQQKIYSKSLDDLKTVKNETYHLQSGLRKAEIKTVKSFKSWMESLKVNNSLSTTGQRDSVENVNCLTCNNNQDILRKPSTKECSCEAEMEKHASLSCCNSVHLQPSANYWANCWTGSLCLGPVCQPLVIDSSQCCDRSNICNRVPIYKGNYDKFKSKSNCTMLCQSGVLRNPECMVQLENAAPTTKTCQSCPVIWHDGSWNTDPKAVRTKDDKAYCCRGIKCDYRFGKDINTICNAETRSCYKYDINHTHKSLPTISEECRCSFSSAAEVSNGQEVDSDQPDSNESDNEDEDAMSAQETSISDLTKETDSAEFKDFMKTVPLTGDLEIDNEIFNFYRNKFCS